MERVNPNQVLEIDAWNCRSCWEPIQDGPMRHNVQCNASFHLQCIETWLKNNLSCPFCRVEVSRDNFFVDNNLREGLEELQQKALEWAQQRENVAPQNPQQASDESCDTTNREKQSLESTHTKMPAKQLLQFEAGVTPKDKKFSKEMEAIKKADLRLFQQHVNKDNVKEIRIDHIHHIVAVKKSGDYHFYQIGKGAAPSLGHFKHFHSGVEDISRRIFP